MNLLREDASEPTHSMDIVEPNSVGEVRVWKEASGSKSSETGTVAIIKPDIIIVFEFLVDAAEPIALLPKNSVDLARSSTPPKNFVYVAGPSKPPS